MHSSEGNEFLAQIEDVKFRKQALVNAMGIGEYNEWMVALNESIGSSILPYKRGEYHLWNILVGGGITSRADKFDFEGDASWLTTLEAKEKELGLK